MAASIIDITKYRSAKQGKESAPALIELSDGQLSARIDYFQHVDENVSAFYNLPEGMQENICPNGYDPDNHPEDNYARLLAEANRRGVEVG